MKDETMEKRSYFRNRTEIPVVCRQFNTQYPTHSISGIMLNYSSNGTYIKSNTNCDKGTILLIRIPKYPTIAKFNGNLGTIRSISIAEVKWVLPIRDDEKTSFGIGLRYLQ
jgi:hypothetical protein